MLGRKSCVLKALQLTVLISAACCALAQAQNSDSVQLGQAVEQELQRARELVLSLESPTDHLDPRLSEPLLQLAESQMRSGNYAEAHATLDRAMQVVRINEGLYTRSQIPLIRKKIENFAEARNWDEARTQLDHLFWLHRTKSDQVDLDLLRDFQELSALHLRAVAEDAYDYQSFHLRRAANASWLALAVGESLWGDTDQRLAPVLYDLVKQYHLHAAAMKNGGRVAYELRQIAPGSNWVRERADAVRIVYLTGNRLLSQLRDIYSVSEPVNAEGLAMSMLYLADWQVMFARDEEALYSYQLAYQGLAESGVSAAQLDAYFSVPTVLPVPEFYSTLESALTARSAEVVEPLQLASLEAAQTIYFNEWSASFPNVRSPMAGVNSPELDSNVALFSFNIAGVTEISHWMSGRREREVASIREATIVEPQSPSEDQQEQLLRRLDSLSFRPSLEAGGVPRESNATLMYQIAGD